MLGAFGGPFSVVNLGGYQCYISVVQVGALVRIL